MASEAEELDHELEVIRAITGVISADKSAYEGPVLNRKGIIVRARLPTNDGEEEVRLMRTPCSLGRRTLLAAAWEAKEKLRLQLGSAAIEAAERQVIAAAAATPSHVHSAAAQACAPAAVSMPTELQPEEMPASRRLSAPLNALMVKQRARAQLDKATARLKEADAAAAEAAAAAAALVSESKAMHEALLPDYVAAFAAVYGEQPSVAEELRQGEAPATAATSVSSSSGRAGAL